MGGAIGGLIDGAFNMASSAMQNAFNRQNMQLQYSLNEQSADNADQRTRALYRDLYSPEAMLEQYKQAGLSPSMMFNQGAGGQGTSGAQAQGVSAPTAVGVDNPNAVGAMLTEAQIKNLNADTESKLIQNADDPTIRNYNTTLYTKLDNADHDANEQEHQARQKLQDVLTQLSQYSKGKTYTVSKSQSDANGNSYGYSINVTDAQGHSESIALATGTTNSETSGFSGGSSFSSNEGKSHGESRSESNAHGHNESHGRGFSWNTAQNVSKAISNSIGEGYNESGYSRTVEDAVMHFQIAIGDIENQRYERKQQAREEYNKNVNKYMDNYKANHKYYQHWKK